MFQCRLGGIEGIVEKIRGDGNYLFTSYRRHVPDLTDLARLGAYSRM